MQTVRLSQTRRMTVYAILLAVLPILPYAVQSPPERSDRRDSTYMLAPMFYLHRTKSQSHPASYIVQDVDHRNTVDNTFSSLPPQRSTVKRSLTKRSTFPTSASASDLATMVRRFTKGTLQIGRAHV